uniref:Complexin-2 n=1 Tax=Lynx canadensis TaxID=61383 RepID=A0A667G5W4_LYNCA
MDFVMKQALGGATKDMGKMLGGEEEKDPDAQKKEEERQEALRQQEEERKAKHARMEAEREKVRQQIRDKYGLKKKEEKEAEEKAALEQPCEGSLTRPKKAIPAGCGDEEEEEEESILDTISELTGVGVDAPIGIKTLLPQLPSDSPQLSVPSETASAEEDHVTQGHQPVPRTARAFCPNSEQL